MTKLLAFYAGMWVHLGAYPTLHECDLLAQKLVQDQNRINTVVCAGPQGAVAYYRTIKNPAGKDGRQPAVGRYKNRGSHSIVPPRHAITPHH